MNIKIWMHLCCGLLSVALHGGWRVTATDAHSCKELVKIANDVLPSGVYIIYNSNSQPFRVYCFFKSGYGYTYLSKATADVNVDLGSLYDITSEVIIRHKRNDGRQYETTMEQISDFSSSPISVQLSSSSGYTSITHLDMGPYIFVGFVPRDLISKNTKQGWKAAGVEKSFSNCDGNPNSYMAFLFNSNNNGYTRQDGSNSLMAAWYDMSHIISSSEDIQDEFLASFFELHEGGCGGFSTSAGYSDVIGATVGMKFGLLYCQLVKCLNGGTCYDLGSDYRCSCVAGYTDKYCQTDINECASSPCKNGTCNNLVNHFSCTCFAGYTGTICETEIDECASGPCRNDGTCVDDVNRYDCFCIEGYSGTFCEIDVNECASSPCLNGGQCIDKVNAFTCVCPGTFVGVVCQLDGYFNNPGIIQISENHDNRILLWGITAQCAVVYQCAYAGIVRCGWRGWWRCYETFYTRCNSDLVCNRCEITSDTSGHFEIGEYTNLYKKACAETNCGPTCTQIGCLNFGEEFKIGIRCYSAGVYSTYYSNGLISTTVTVHVTENVEPEFTYSKGDAIDIYKGLVVPGDVINQLIATDADTAQHTDYIRYKHLSGPEPSWIHHKILFGHDTNYGTIKLLSSLDFEFSYTFQMTECVYDRREKEICHPLTITLHACYQTPNCSNQEDLNVWDTHGLYTGHGDTNRLFQMVYPQPTNHFPLFNPSWHQLQWRFVTNEMGDDNVTIDQNTGEINVLRNISIFPAWRSKDFQMVVEVSNPSASCYVTTCNMFVRVWYKNWPIQIRSLPSSISLHEDTDREVLLHNLVVYDYNYYWEDNMTCVIHNINPWEDNLFELRNSNNGNGTYSWNSYQIYKMACIYPDCGYKYSNYLCPRNQGCMNHNQTQQYIVTIMCSDAYDTYDVKDFTFNVIKNRAPYWINLPKTVVLDADKVAELDTVYSMIYWDLENETLNYEYWYADIDVDMTIVQYNVTDKIYDSNPHYFYGDRKGNYYDNLANITMTTYLHDKPVNKTYWAFVCGHERRNEICDYLFIHINRNCGQTPQCSSVEKYVNETYTGVLFNIASLVNQTSLVSSQELSYAIAARGASLFSVNTLTGDITSIGPLRASRPSSTYYINAFVYETNACHYGYCSLKLTVATVNYPLVIENLPYTVTFQEDVTKVSTLYLISTSDQNTDDTVNCSITNMDSVEPFYLSETYTGSQQFVIKIRSNYVFPVSRTIYNINVSCFDMAKEGMTKTVTINVTRNERPRLLNLTTSVSVNPAIYGKDMTIFPRVEASDTENDHIDFTCNVANTFVPLECNFAARGTNYIPIKLRRNVDIVRENNMTYSIEVCVGDAKHVLVLRDCKNLSVTITGNRTYPVLSNLPSYIHIDEKTAVGTTLFTVSVTDPDVGDKHVITMSVAPAICKPVFNLDSSTGVLKLANFLNFEVCNHYLVEFKVRDQYLSAKESKYLNISVDNVNEGNTLKAARNVINLTESTAVGALLSDAGLSCTDEDIGDTLRYSLQATVHSAYFRINATTGHISLAQKWTLDYLTSTEIVAVCTDAGGLSSSATLFVNIDNIKEFAPTINLTASSGAGDTNVIKIDAASASLTTPLLVVMATETNQARKYKFSILGDGIAAKYFRMVINSRRKRAVTTGSSASLFLKEIPKFVNDKTFQITIKISDSENDVLHVGKTITIVYAAAGPVAKSAETKCTLCTPNGKIVVIVMTLEGIIIICVIIHICCKMVCAKRFGTPNNTTGAIISKDNVITKLTSNKSSTRTKELSTKGPIRVKVTPQSNTINSVKRFKGKQSESPYQSSSSSSSSDSDDDELDTRRNVNEVAKSSFAVTRHHYAARNSTTSTGLPPPVYTFGLTSTPMAPLD